MLFLRYRRKLLLLKYSKQLLYSRFRLVERIDKQKSKKKRSDLYLFSRLRSRFVDFLRKYNYKDRFIFLKYKKLERKKKKYKYFFDRFRSLFLFNFKLERIKKFFER